MDTVIYLDVNNKEVSRKTVEGKGRRPNEKDAAGNFIIRIKEGFKLENGKVLPIPKKDRIVNPVPVVQEIKAPETPQAPVDPVTETPKTAVTETPKAEAAQVHQVIENSQKASVKMVIYLNSQNQELLRKPRGKGREPKETDKDGNYIVRIKDEFLAKFMKDHNLDGTATATVLSKKDSEVFVDKVLKEVAPDEALKEAATKAKEQKVEAPDTETPNTETPKAEEPEEYEVSERRKKKLTIDPVYTVDEIMDAIMYSDTENTNNPNGNITIMNGVMMKNSIPELHEVLPFNAVFAKIEINVQENSIKAWALPSDNKGNFVAPDRECYGCLKL